MSIINNYTIKQLTDAFNYSKQIIKDKKKEVVIINDDSMELNLKKLEMSIPKLSKLEPFSIYSIPVEEALMQPYIHLSGVNVMFYIVCLYFIATDEHHGIYYKYHTSNREKERCNILKKKSFIFKEDKNGFLYFPINKLESTPYFKFDLPPVPTMLKKRK